VRERCKIVHNDAAMTMSPAAARALVASDSPYELAEKLMLEK